MFKLPTNHDLLEFIAQHVDIEMTTKILDASMHQGGRGSDACEEIMDMRPKGRNKFLSELSVFNKVRGRVDGLAPIIAMLMANLSSDGMEAQKKCVDHVLKQFRLLECTYDSIRLLPLYTLMEQPRGNSVMVELFLLPYLKRISQELNELYPNNFLFYYLRRYVDVIFVPLDNPMAAFISEHKCAFREFSTDADYLSGYRADRYKKLSTAFHDYLGEGVSTLQFLGWHIAGNMIRSVIKRSFDEKFGGWFGGETLSIVQHYNKHYDNVYECLLSLHVKENVHYGIMANNNFALQSIIREFMAYIDAFHSADDFMSAISGECGHQALYESLREALAYRGDFGWRIHNGKIPSKENVAHAQHLLDTVYRSYHLGYDTAFFAFDIFIAKYLNGEAKRNGALIACERALFESGVDLLTEPVLNITVGKIDDLDMTYAEHMRCRYVGYYNWRLKNKLSRYDFINPIMEVEQFLLSIIKPLDLQMNSKGREYALVTEDIIVKQAKQVRNPCVGVMKFGLKAVITNLAFFEYVFQLGYEYPEDDDEVLDVGIWRYALLTEQQKKTLLGLIPDEPNRLNNVDMDLIPEL